VTRVVVAEDHPLFRDAIAALVDGLPGTTVVATTDTVAGLLEAVTVHRPDVAVVDLGLADGSVLDRLGELRTAAPGCRLLVLTSADDDEAVDGALRHGAHGYLLKSSAPADIARAVTTVAGGDGVFDGSVTTRIARRFAVRPGGPSSPFPQLTARELEVLELMARGRSNAQIADHHVLSLKTVRNHVSTVLAKLGAATRAEAIVLARRAGLGD
jgi:DNA-binding NarL/FixJ family response regulator